MPERGSLDALLWKVPFVAGCLWLLYLSLDIVLLTLISIVLAAAILPLADSLQRRRVPRAVTVLGAYAIGIDVFTPPVASPARGPPASGSRQARRTSGAAWAGASVRRSSSAPASPSS